MKISERFAQFMTELLKHDKNAATPTRKQYKRITEKAARKRGIRTFGLESKWHVSVVRHFGTFRPVKPFNY